MNSYTVKFFILLLIISSVSVVYSQQIEIDIPEKRDLNIALLDSNEFKLKEFQADKVYNINNFIDFRIMMFGLDLKQKEIVNSFYRFDNYGKINYSKTCIPLNNSSYFIDINPLDSYKILAPDRVSTNYMIGISLNKYIYKGVYTGIGIEPTLTNYSGISGNKWGFTMRAIGIAGYHF